MSGNDLYFRDLSEADRFELLGVLDRLVNRFGDLAIGAWTALVTFLSLANGGGVTVLLSYLGDAPSVSRAAWVSLVAFVVGIVALGVSLAISALFTRRAVQAMSEHLRRVVANEVAATPAVPLPFQRAASAGALALMVVSFGAFLVGGGFGLAAYFAKPDPSAAGVCEWL